MLGLKHSCLGSKISDRNQTQTKRSAGIPWYVTKPKTAKGAAPHTQTQDTSSVPTTGCSQKYNPTAAKMASSEKTDYRRDSPKNMDS